MTVWRMVAALLACLVTAAMVSIPRLGPASDRGEPMDLRLGKTPARIQLANLLAAFNSGDRETIEHYRDSNVSPYWKHPPSTEATLWWFKQTGGYRVLQTEDVGPNHVAALVRNVDSDEVFELEVDVERMQPHRLMYINLNRVGEVPDRYVPLRLRDDEAIAELRADLATRVSADKFAGAILVMHGEKVLFREGFGYADREAHLANKPDTKFRLGNSSNMFVAAAILRLAQEGRLRVDDRLDKLLPDLSGEDLGSITIDQLLTSSGGMQDLLKMEAKADRRKLRTPGDYVELFGDIDLVDRPGHKFAYNSLNYVLLGAVIERVSGRALADYLDDAVFRPAGMTQTDLWFGEHRAPGRAMPYLRPPGTRQWVPLTELLPHPGTAVGGAYSTVGDIAHFLAALQSGRILDTAHAAQMLQPRIVMWPSTWYGYGLTFELRDGVRWITHADGVEGQNSHFLFRPETGHLVVVLSNFDAPAASNVAQFIAARLPDVPRPFEMNIAPE